MIMSNSRTKEKMKHALATNVGWDVNDLPPSPPITPTYLIFVAPLTIFPRAQTKNEIT